MSWSSEMQAPARVGDPIAAVDTPALMLDLDAFEANLRAVHASVAASGLALRAHGKAHKCVEIARRQVAAGAVGVCCQKVAEAEVFVAGGIRDVLVSNQVIGAGKLRRLARLSQRALIGVCVDHPQQVRALADALAQEGGCIDVLIEVDVGGGRCGVIGEAAVLELAALVAAHAPALRLRGLQAYHGRAQHRRTPEERREAIAAAAAAAAAARDALRAAGHDCPVITGAGTGTYPLEAATGVYTEVQPGSYVLMDADYFANQPDPQAPALRQALTLHCQVISERPGQVVLDAGLKAFSVDSGLPVPLAEGWRAVSISDEHLVLRPSADGARATLRLGDTLQVVPGHCDPTVNLHDHLVAHRAGRVEAVWPVDARGALT
jgi:D-serine deaminase-like pyridoxal phosphate-dependent protein